MMLALVLAGAGVYFLVGSDTTTKAQAAIPDYKVDWTATKYLVIDWEKFFYPNGGKGTFQNDPATANPPAKQRLAIGVHEWKVIYSVKRDGCDQNIPNCYQVKYNETWRTGADPSINPHFLTGHCYKVPANCDNSNPNAIYTGQWNWSLGSEFTESPNIRFGNKTFRDVTEVGIADVSDSNLYVSNSTIYSQRFSPCDDGFGNVVECWFGPRGFGPGFLEAYQCSNTNGNATCRPTFGWSAQNLYHSTYFYTASPYAWQHTPQIGPFKPNEQEMNNGSDASGTLTPTKWFVSGVLYD